MAKPSILAPEEMTNRPEVHTPKGKVTRGDNNDSAASALKSALLALILDDEDVRDAIRSCLPDATASAAPSATLPESPDAERAAFITDLIEGYVGRYIRPDALRRPLR